MKTKGMVKKANIIDFDLDKDGNLWYLVNVVYIDNTNRRKWLLETEFKIFIKNWQYEIPILMGNN